MPQSAETYERALAAVRGLVNAWDPLGLIKAGFPADEYDPEVADLARLVLHPAPIDQQAVDSVWLRWFGDDNYRLAGSEQAASFAARLVQLQIDFVDG